MSQVEETTPELEGETRHQQCAGGLVVRGGEILLIAMDEGRRWQLPKGHIEPGESPEEAGVREVREETGVTGRVLAPLPVIEYCFLDRKERRVRKTVQYFLLGYVGGDTADYDRGEVSGAQWFPWREGLAALTFDNEREVARQARSWCDGRAGREG